MRTDGHRTKPTVAFRNFANAPKKTNKMKTPRHVDPKVSELTLPQITSGQNFIIPYLYEAQYVSGDTPPIIRSLKLHWQPLVFHKWKVVRRAVDGRCQAQCA